MAFLHTLALVLSSALRPLPAEAVVQAQAALDSGQPIVALQRLEPIEGKLQDRVSLIRAEAFLATHQYEQAREAFREAERLARTPEVRVDARIGLVEVLGALGAHEERVRVLEALDPYSAVYHYRWAESLLELDRRDEATEKLLRLRIEQPATSFDDAVGRHLARLGVALDPSQRKRRLENLLDANQAAAARAELATLSLSEREKAWYEHRVERAAGRADTRGLEALHAAEPGGAFGDEVLYALARGALSADRNDDAQAYYDELVKRFPDSVRAPEAEYLAGWIDYAEARYGGATKRMLGYADRRPRHPRTTEALWYAGWSSFLARDFDGARAAYERLRTRYPSSDLVPFAWYWTGRSYGEEKLMDDAARCYQNAAQLGPFTYYGFLARARLEQLGQPVAWPAIEDEVHQFGVDQVLSALGPDRPIQIDRAIAFHRAGRDDWAEDELDAAYAAMGPAGSVREQVMRADLGQAVGGYRHAFQLGLRVGVAPSKVADGDYWAWRVFQHRFPPAYPAAVRTSAETHGVDEALIWSIMRTESHYQRDARSRVGALGLMQIMPATARQIGAREADAKEHAHKLLVPESNVWLGGWYLARLADRFPGFIPLQIASYNAGPTAAQRWLDAHRGMPSDAFIELITYKETRRYVRRVLETMWTYQVLYDLPRTTLTSSATVGAAPRDAVEF